MTLFKAQVFERTGKSEDQDETPVGIDGELRTFEEETQTKRYTLMHSHHTSMSLLIQVDLQTF